jgi:hypothetical protein
MHNTSPSGPTGEQGIKGYVKLMRLRWLDQNALTLLLILEIWQGFVPVLWRKGVCLCVQFFDLIEHI